MSGKGNQFIKHYNNIISQYVHKEHFLKMMMLLLGTDVGSSFIKLVSNGTPLGIG
jgi:hypothetical protein